MPKTSPINMRVEPAQHVILTKAAAALNMDRSTFILNVACREAESVLLDQRLFSLSESEYTKFKNAINKPIPENTKLKALLKGNPSWKT